jgi:hypothetical protein
MNFSLKIILMEPPELILLFNNPSWQSQAMVAEERTQATTLQKKDIPGCYFSLLKSFLNLGPFFSSSTTLRVSQKKTTLQNHALDDCHLQLKNF